MRRTAEVREVRVAGFESWSDRQIREAIERGEFDNLPGVGKPLEGLDGRDDEKWWIKSLIRREKITGVLPGSLSLLKETDAIVETVADCRIEEQVREIVRDLNARIVDARRRGVDGPHVFVKTVDVERVVRAWRERRDVS